METVRKIKLMRERQSDRQVDRCKDKLVILSI